MEVLKALLIIAIILNVGINGEETHREGKCNGGKSGRGHIGHPHQKQKVHLRKPYPLVHHATGEKFNGKGKFHSKGDSFSQVNANVDQGLQKPFHKQPVPVKEPEPFTFDMQSADHLIADPSEIPSTFGISPRLNISPDGEISLGRSMSFDKQRNFNDDSNADSINEHMDEDHDLLHKIRTARSAPAPIPNKVSGHEQLSKTVNKLADTNTLQGVNVHNGAQSGETFNLNASGDSISASNQGSSSASGSGTITATGSTSVVTSGSGSSSGWKATK